MTNLLIPRLRQGKRTLRFPEAEPTLPDRFRGLPMIDQSRCAPGCKALLTSAPPTQ